MKRAYIAPRTEAIIADAQMPLAASGVSGSNGIGFGGVDTEGELEPDVKADGFDFEWSEE